MASFSTVNPFAKKENHEVQAVWTYKVLTMITWLLAVLVSIYYTYGMPDRTIDHGGKTIWILNKTHHTLFALDELVTSIYWTLIFGLQVAYMWHLFSVNNSHVQAAAGVGSHFVINNILKTGFVLLFINEHFIWAELILLINFCNLLVLYFGHNTYPRLIHVPVTSGPLAWTFIALYWNGAIAVNIHAELVHILANVVIWGILVFGWFFLFFFKDYTMTFALGILCASIGLEQFLTHTNIWQWSFAFAIAAFLLISTLLIGVPNMFGKELILKRDLSVVPEDSERAPLFNDSLRNYS